MNVTMPASRTTDVNSSMDRVPWPIVQTITTSGCRGSRSSARQKVVAESEGALPPRRLRIVGNTTAPTPEDVPPPARSSVSPDLVRSYRWQLTPGEDVIDTASWAGSIPRVNGVAPRVRVGSRWFNLLWLLPIGFVLLIVAVAVAKGLRTEPSVRHFIARYPGTGDPSHPDVSSGFPVWWRIQHFFNLFLLIFIVRAGVQILSDHPRLYWTRHSTPGRDWFR